MQATGHLKQDREMESKGLTERQKGYVNDEINHFFMPEPYGMGCNTFSFLFRGSNECPLLSTGNKSVIRRDQIPSLYKYLVSKGHKVELNGINDGGVYSVRVWKIGKEFIKYPDNFRKTGTEA